MAAEAGAPSAVATTPRAPIAYYPGCSLHGTSREFDESLRAVLAALRIPIHEIDDWSCCGASSGHTTDHLLGVALPARNLALAEAQGFASVLAPCAACYNRLTAARLAVAAEDDLAERMPDVLGRPFANTVAVESVVALLRDVRDGDRRGGRRGAHAQPARGAATRRLLRLPARAAPGDRGRRRPRGADVHGRGDRRLRRRRRGLEHEGRVLRRRLQREPHELGGAPRPRHHRGRAPQRRRGDRGRLSALPLQPRPAPEGHDDARRGADARALHHAGRRPRARPSGRERSASTATSSTPSPSSTGSSSRRRRASPPRSASRRRRRRSPPPAARGPPPSDAPADDAPAAADTRASQDGDA